MKLTATVKLQPTDEQRDLLYETLNRANTACNYISEQVWGVKQFGRVPTHHATYATVRSEFGLGAQLAVRCIGKVVDAYKLDRKTKRQFKRLGAVPYDNRILNYRMADQAVSIWLLGGRQTIPFVTGAHQLVLLAFQHGQSNLVHRKGNFYLYAACEIPEDDPVDPEGWLGVDLGIANIAVDNDGQMYSGSTIKNVRHRRRRLRQKLQRKGTLGTHRRLKKLAGKEQRFARHVNHMISKQLVHKAQDTRHGIALEDLGGIRERVTVRKSQRAGLHSWSFYQLRSFIEYKARRAGVLVVAVDPRNTSRTCPSCGYVDKANRRTQAHFSCIQCGFAAPADYVAAINIGRRAAVNQPHYSDTRSSPPPSGGYLVAPE
jgi:IS605 OrfB family transposase